MSEQTSDATTALYRHFAADGTLLYVGVSLNVVVRLAQHKAASHWHRDIARVEVEQFATRKAALEAEAKAIKDEAPKHNIQKRFREKPLTRAEKAALAAQAAADYSRASLVQRMVAFHPLYSIDDVCNVLHLGETAVRRLIHGGELGHVKFDSVTKRKIAVTGWQLIDYLERLQARTTGS